MNEPTCVSSVAVPNPVPRPPDRAAKTADHAARDRDDGGDLELSKQAELHDVLRRLHAVVDGVHGTVLATRDGLPVASTLVGPTVATVAAMAATVIALADQAVPSDGGAEGTTVIRGSEGCLVVQGAGAAGVLAVQTGAQPNLGLIHVEAPTVAASLAVALGASC